MERIDLSKISMDIAGDLFDVDEDFVHRIRTLYNNADTVIELRDQIRSLTMTEEQRDYAMFIFGQRVKMNDLIADPRPLIRQLIMKDPLALLGAALKDPSILDRLDDLI